MKRKSIMMGKNQYSLYLNGLNHVFIPLSRKEVYENQIKIKKSFDEFVRKEKKA